MASSNVEGECLEESLQSVAATRPWLTDNADGWRLVAELERGTVAAMPAAGDEDVGEMVVIIPYDYMNSKERAALPLTPSQEPPFGLVALECTPGDLEKACKICALVWDNSVLVSGLLRIYTEGEHGHGGLLMFKTEDGSAEGWPCGPAVLAFLREKKMVAPIGDGNTEGYVSAASEVGSPADRAMLRSEASLMGGLADLAFRRIWLSGGFGP